MLTEKVANLKGPPALLSPRDTRKNTGGEAEVARERERGNRRTLDFEQAIMLLRNVYNEIIVSGILRPRVTAASADLSCIISFIRPRDPQTAGGVSFVDGNNVKRVRHHVACTSLY